MIKRIVKSFCKKLQLGLKKYEFLGNQIMIV